MILLALAAAAASMMPTVPGDINPNVTQDNIAQTICIPNWTATVRPPASYTNALKRKQMAALNLTGPMSSYEEDHLIPLAVGGNPTSPNNLWPQPWEGPFGAHSKDRLEVKLHKLVCNRTMSLDDARTAIRSSWVDAYRKFIGPLP